MPRNLQIALGILSVAVLIGLISLNGLHNRIQKLSENQNSEEQSRRELLAPPISTPTDVKVKTKIFWAAGPDRTAPVEVELTLSADPVQRARQVLHALIETPPTPDLRTLPADTTLLAFYILPDGTAIADFSDALAVETPSGIMSEELAIDSIARTLENNLANVHRLKLLIHGQEADTLAGHLDLTGFFDLNPPGQQSEQPAASPSQSASQAAAPSAAAAAQLKSAH
ncbi:MAG: GerMN domain-containing protein [Candidatus Acidiferrales bacterium]